MRSLCTALLILFGLGFFAPVQGSAQSCAAGQATTISGIVYAPNGTDPLPNVLVYIPSTAVDAFTPGVSCPISGTPPSGNAIVGTTTAVDGSFTLSLANVSATANIPLVIQSGRWRRQVTIATTTSCANTVVDPSLSRFPKNHTEGDIPLFAIATGSQDQVECILRKVGIDDAEFTNPGGGGRINLFSGSGSAGARVDANTPSQNALMSDPTVLNQYDVLMLPCQGSPYTQTAGSLSDFESFANAGGRVYSSHFSYVWMNNNPPFDTVVNWKTQQNDLPSTGTATVDTSFNEGATLAQWLQLVGATTTQGQMPLQVIKHDFNGVNAPTQSWLALNYAASSNPVMQFVFNAPVKATNQCGRVLFNEYHVENPAASNTNKPFPSECTITTFTPQEKLLEYSLFELTNDGGSATLLPTSADFGSEPVSFTTAAKTFTWTNNSTFPASVTLLNVTGDFAVASNNCTNVASGASCAINVTFTPTALGARTGTLSVGSGATTLTAALTGTGITALSIAPSTTDFGNVDVGATSTRTLVITNSAPGALPVPSLGVTGDYTATPACSGTIPANGTCNVTVVFKPTTTGARPGSVTINSAAATGPTAVANLTGNGVDFTFTVSPTSGSIIAGYGAAMTGLTTPIAGFAAPVTISCTTNAPATTCTPKVVTFIPAAATSTEIDYVTISQYTVVGYHAGYTGLLALFGLMTGGVLWHRRRKTGTLIRATLVALLLAVVSLSATGCSGKLPTTNLVYTPAGSYTFTVTATDGFLIHSATYALTVTAK